MANHTKGPWELLDDEDSGMRVMGYSDTVIIELPGQEPHEVGEVEICSFYIDEPLEEITANAFLVSAAPDMHEALQAVLDVPTANLPAPVWEMVFAALKKASGQTYYENLPDEPATEEA